ncbi:hypothetical protein RJ639_038803 [Escallonia herrerae]|uniref:Mediator of RNA polymerase II transcription subunit 13 n=1 Tax=Escallonia herrerae TaxID=1293975 RepID=A0AA89BAX5_9ASTE|nr:hypothetical protein RJ639_038803 [Escallonia herrerae]
MEGRDSRGDCERLRAWVLPSWVVTRESGTDLGGGLHQVSWFQFLPHEPDLNPLPEKSVKADQKDAATLLVLSSHLQLQKEGFLSTWTNSFVGPWDPSQGLHNLFLVRFFRIVMEVLASGLWLAPGDSEEVATALSQALMNCIERLISFVEGEDPRNKTLKTHPFELGRRCWYVDRDKLGKEQASLVLLVPCVQEGSDICAVVRHIRALSSGDMEMMSKHSPSCSGDGLPAKWSFRIPNHDMIALTHHDMIKRINSSPRALATIMEWYNTEAKNTINASKKQKIRKETLET